MMKKTRQFFRSLELVVVVAIVLFCAILFIIGLFVEYPNTTLQFLSGLIGALIGGLITYLSVRITIINNRQLDEDAEKKLIRHNLKLLYLHLKFQKGKVDELYDHIIAGPPNVHYVPMYEMFTKNDFDYYFEKLVYTDNVFSPEEIERLNEYYKELLELEEERVKFYQNTLGNTAIDGENKYYQAFLTKLKSAYRLEYEDRDYANLGVVDVSCKIGELLEKLRNELGIEKVKTAHDDFAKGSSANRVN